MQASMEAVNFESKEDSCMFYFKPKDHILLDIESQDIWLSVILKMSSGGHESYDCQFKIKTDVNMVGAELKTLIQRLCISIWNRLQIETPSASRSR